MRALTGDETGLLKVINLNKKEIVNRWGTQTREAGVARLSWLPAGTNDSELSSARVAVLTKKGVVQVWDTATGTLQHTCSNAGAEGAILATRASRYITCSGDGLVRVFSLSAKDADKQSVAKFSVKPSVATARLHAARGVIAVGGKEHDLALWDLETQQPVFEARNVGQTTLSLRVPVWVSGVQFLGEPGAAAALSGVAPSLAPDSSSGHVVVTVTGHKHVRLYDTRATDRRPVRSADLGEYAFTAVELAQDGRTVVTGDGGGVLRRVDLGTFRQIGGYKGAGGSIRSICVHPRQPVFASACLDRALRVHHVGNRKLLRRLHLKQRLTAVLLAPETAKDRKEEHEEEGEEEGDGEEGEAEELAPEPLPDLRIRITQRAVEADPRRAREDKDKSSGAGGDEDEDGEEVWRELDRRVALVKAGASGPGARPANAGASLTTSATKAASAGSKRPRTDPSDSDDEEGEEDEDEDDDDDESEDDGLGPDEDSQNDDADDGVDDESDDDDEDSDGSNGVGFSDEDEEEDDDGSDDDGGEDEDDDGAAALVDSRKAAKVLLRQSESAKVQAQRKGAPAKLKPSRKQPSRR